MQEADTTEATPVEAEERLATVEELAVLTFSAEDGAIEKCLGSRQEWIGKMASDYQILRIAARALQQDDVGLHAMVQAVGIEAALEFTESFHAMSGRYAAIAHVLTAIQTRFMAAASRNALMNGDVA